MVYGACAAMLSLLSSNHYALAAQFIDAINKRFTQPTNSKFQLLTVIIFKIVFFYEFFNIVFKLLYLRVTNFYCRFYF